MTITICVDHDFPSSTRDGQHPVRISLLAKGVKKVTISAQAPGSTLVNANPYWSIKLVTFKTGNWVTYATATRIGKPGEAQVISGVTKNAYAVICI